MCLTSNCDGDPEISKLGNGVYSVRCGKCGGWMCTYVSDDDNYYEDGLVIFDEMLKELTPKGKKDGHQL